MRFAHLNFGRLLLFKGDNPGAFRELQRAHELMATDPNLPLYEALALKGLGNVEESRLHCRSFSKELKGSTAIQSYQHGREAFGRIEVTPFP